MSSPGGVPDSSRGQRVSSLLRAGLFLIACASLAPATAWGHGIEVTSTADDGSPGTLRWAIGQINSEGTGVHGIEFDLPPNSTIQLLSDLPAIDNALPSQINIDASDAPGLTIDGGGSRVFFVATGKVTISDMSIQNAQAKGGDGGIGAGGGGGGLGAGGALFVNAGATVTLRSVDLIDNSAAGGNGGVGVGSGSAGGGGGLGGSGGNGSSGNFGGGGGGGYSGAGGSGQGDGGAGGGALTNGSNSTTSTGGNGAGGTAGGTPGNPGSPGTPGTGGGGGGLNASGGAGGVFGGGGGSGVTGARGGNGGDFGGGGGASTFGSFAGDGGFGGGGGGASSGAVAGTSGFGGGAGGDGSSAQSGGGGAGYGGAIFVRAGGTLTVQDTTVNGGAVAGGLGSTMGDAAGTAYYLHAGSTTTIGTTFNVEISDTLAGSGTLNKNGPAALTLSGNSPYSGTINNLVGGLVINGNIAGGVNNEVNGRLAGSGDIGGHVVNRGTLAPGDATTTLRVGSLTNEAGSNTVVNIDPNGHASQVVVDNNATISGGNVHVVASAGEYQAGTKYKFLTASSVSGQFDSITDDLSFLSAALQYDPTSAYFILTPTGNYVQVAITHNQYAFGTYLDQIANYPNAELQLVLEQINTLDADQARDAYNQMDGDLYGTLGQVGVQNTTLVIYQLNNRLATPLLTEAAYAQTSGFDGASSPVVFVKQTGTPGGVRFVNCNRCEPGWHAWSFGYGIGGNVQSNGNASGINYGMGGMLGGLERYLTDETLLGFYGGYVGTGVTARNVSQSASINGGQFGSYMRRFDGFNHWTAIGGLGFDGYQTRRNIAFADINTSATSNYNGWQGYAYGERGVTFGGSRLQLQPYGALQYVYLRQNQFDEGGAGVLSLDGRGTDSNSLRTFVGGRALFAPASRLSPQLRAAWVHELLSPVSIVNAHFGPIGGGAFAVQGLSLGRDYALVGGGLNWRLSDGWSLWGSYDAMVNSRQVFHIGSGGVQYVW